MNRISEKFRHLKLDKKTALIPYITPEFPVKGVTVPLIAALEQTGASMIEIGLPFSDPLADGPTIQHSSEVAIRNGVTASWVLGAVREARTKTDIPLIVMGYFNPILHFGIENFLREANNAGVDGLIVPDLLPEESGEFIALSKQYGMSNIFLIAPTSSDERIRRIDELSTDFTYCVSVTGVTGARSSFGDSGDFTRFLARVQKNVKKPFVVGFGIKEKEQVRMISGYSDGAVVGSALLQAIAEQRSVDSVVTAAKKFMASMV